jgi:MinD superfamily P-loop ATPase
LKIAVASGKGGTGKTTVVVNLALSLENAHIFDCDVEEPNAHTLLHPDSVKTTPVTVPTPVIDQDKCTLCGKCADFCQFNAIFVGKTKVILYEEICHSCGGCVLVCPEKAVSERDREVGNLHSDTSGKVDLTYGALNVGEPMAVPLIKR